MGTNELLFRYYRLPENTPPKRVFKAGDVDVANALLEVGREGGQGKTIEGTLSYTQTFYVDQASVESRE